jgi:predicted transcriptional regulator of viral defense system
MTRESSTPKPEERRFISTRDLLAKLARAARGGILTVSNAGAVMDLPRRKTAMSLGALARRGWLLRARRGLYYVLPLEAQPGRPTISEDPWVLAREAFSPCYIGGWSAAEHWGLTEQLFRSTLVVTAKNFRTTKINVLGNEFRLFRVPHSRIAGTINVWRGRERVPISDRERTIIDALRRPELCGGVRHLADIMREYGRSAERDFRKLSNVAREFANGATWKRLGYLAEVLWPEEKALAGEARNHLTAGIVKLDPRVSRRGTLLRRWGLWINAAISKEA